MLFSQNLRTSRRFEIQSPTFLGSLSSKLSFSDLHFLVSFTQPKSYLVCKLPKPYHYSLQGLDQAELLRPWWHSIFVLYSWLFPFSLAVISCLQTQNSSGSWGHSHQIWGNRWPLCPAPAWPNFGPYWCPFSLDRRGLQLRNWVMRQYSFWLISNQLASVTLGLAFSFSRL